MRSAEGSCFNNNNRTRKEKFRPSCRSCNREWEQSRFLDCRCSMHLDSFHHCCKWFQSALLPQRILHSRTHNQQCTQSWKKNCSSDRVQVIHTSHTCLSATCQRC